MIKLSPFQWASFNFFGFYCAYGVLLPFLPMWLNFHGYDTETIGLLIASGYLFRFIGAMFFAKRVSHSNQLISLNRALTWATVLVLIGMAWAVSSVWLLLPVFALFHILNGGAMPIADTISSTWQQQIGLDYGKTRLFGSIAFVVGSISTGYLVADWGENSILWILLGFLVMLGCGQLLNPSQWFHDQPKTQTQNDIGYWLLFKVPTTWRMLLAVSLIQASHAAYYAYSTIYWNAQGISTQQASLLWGVAVLAEIVFFFFSNKLFKTWKISHLIMLSALGSVLRWILLANISDFSLLVIVQCFHALSYGMGHYAMIRYIATQEVKHIAKLQALYFGCASCVLMALFTFIAGLAYQHSPTVSFWLMVIFAAPALFIVPKRFAVKLEH